MAQLESLVELMQSTVSGSSTERLEGLLQRVAERTGAWNAILQRRANAPPLVLMQSPTLSPETLQELLRTLETPPASDADDELVWRLEPLSIPDTFYVVRLPRDRAAERFWNGVAELVRLLSQQEQLHQEIDALRRQSDRYLLTVATLHETALASSHQELERFLQLVTERAAHAMDAQACTLMLLEPSGQALTIAASYGLSEELAEKVRIPLGEGIAGRVALTKKPIIITDPAQHPELNDIVPRPEISSSICVPLHNRAGHLLGVLTLRRLHPAPPFTKEDLNTFLIFASQIAFAIENAQLYADLNRRIQELTTLVNLSQVVSAVLDIDTLLELVGRQIKQVVGFSRYALFLQSESSRAYQPVLIRGYTREMFPPRGFRKGQGVIGIVAKKKMPLVVQDARHELQPIRGFGRTIGANRYCVLPIVIHGSCIGVVLADNEDRSGEFSAEQVDLLSVFIMQAGIAIENARLYREMEQRYREIQNLAAFRYNILRSLGAGVFTLSAQGNIGTWNRAAQSITGIRSREVIGKHYSVLCELVKERMSEESQQALENTLSEVLQGGGARSLYNITLRKSPTVQEEAHILNFTITPLVVRGDENTGGAVVVFEDVTEYHRMEARLSQMGRLAEIGQMTATIAHEIRNPLTALKGAADLLAQDEGIPSEVQTYVDIIRQEVARLREIADEFLEFARPFVLNRRPTPLRPLLERLMQALTPYFREANIHAQLQIAGEPEAMIDPARIEQVLRNLIQNAIQAMPNGGQLTLRAGEENGKLYLQVQDNGVGILPEIRDKIFSPFYTTRTRGTGLGLSIVQKIVQAHEGEVRLECPPEGGSIFTVWLPKIVREV